MYYIIINYIIQEKTYCLISPLLKQGALRQLSVNFCYLSESGRKIFLREYDDRLNTTIKHRNLNRNVSYRHLIRLECYKLEKHISNIEEYKAFRAWW